MNLILFVIFLGFSAGFLLFVNYYRKLFSLPKANFTKEEIVSFKEILLGEFQHLTSHNPSSYMGVGVGVFLGFIISHMGGLYGAHYESYFFNSIAVPGIVFLSIPYLKDNFYTEIEKLPFLKDIFLYDTPFLFGISASFMAQIMVTYGLYHALSFLWIAINYVGIGIIFIYRIYSNEKEGSIPVDEE